MNILIVISLTLFLITVLLFFIEMNKKDGTTY